MLFTNNNLWLNGNDRPLDMIFNQTGVNAHLASTQMTPLTRTIQIILCKNNY